MFTCISSYTVIIIIAAIFSIMLPYLPCTTHTIHAHKRAHGPTERNGWVGGRGGGQKKEDRIWNKTGFEIISCCTVCRAKSLTQFWRHRCVLTPSLPQSVKFPGWKMHGRACKECIFWSCNTSASNAVHFDENPFTCQVKRRQKGSRVSNFALLLVIFKWHHGSEGVKKTTPPPPPPQQSWQGRG